MSTSTDNIYCGVEKNCFSVIIFRYYFCNSTILINTMVVILINGVRKFTLHQLVRIKLFLCFNQVQ